jgi:dihydrofolate reductase
MADRDGRRQAVRRQAERPRQDRVLEDADRAPWGSLEEATVTRDDPGAEIPRLKAREGKDMVVWGSLTLVQSLAEATLVDEYQLLVLPLVLGGGRPLFAEGVGPITIELLEEKPTDRSATLLRYEPR